MKRQIDRRSLGEWGRGMPRTLDSESSRTTGEQKCPQVRPVQDTAVDGAGAFFMEINMIAVIHDLCNQANGPNRVF